MSNEKIAESIAASRRVLTAARRADMAFVLRSHMVEKRLKNIDVAARLGVSEANVSRWLRGDQNLSLDTLHALSDALQSNLAIELKAANDQTHANDDEWSPAPMLVKQVVDGVFDLGAYRELRKSALLVKDKPFAKPKSEVMRDINKENDEPSVAVG